MDEAHIETENILKSLERRITKEYRQAEEELQEKIDDYFRKFKYKDETWQKWVKDGSKTQAQYNEWRIGQMAIGRRWEEQKQVIVQDMSRANETARKIVSEKMPDVYAINHNYGTYEVEHGAKVDTGYTLYDHNTVEGLFKERKIYHDPGRTTLKKISQGLEQRWNRQNVQSAIMQGILQGESIPKMASRLADAVGEKNRKAAIRNARTITTGVQNKGRVDSYKRANKMGIPTQKQWIATLDERTRHSHRAVDGEVVPENEIFSNGLEYPGDPGGAPAEIYNCRCTVIASIKGFEIDASDLSNRRSEKLGDMTYDEWKNAKAKSQDILHGEKVGKAMKDAYTGEYKGLNVLEKASDNGNIKYRVGRSVEPTPKTYEMALNRKEYAESIADKYGINLRGSGRDININIDDAKPNPGWVTKDNPSVINLGGAAFTSEEELAVTIAHELNHSRSYLAGGDAPEGTAYDAEEKLRQYIRGMI